MKKIYLVLCLAVALIAPECCAMKQLSKNIAEKCIKFKFYKNSIKNKSSLVDKWNMGFGTVMFTAYAGFNGFVSYSGGYAYPDGLESNDIGPILSVLMPCIVEFAVVNAHGPVGAYSAFQAAIYFAGYGMRKYDEKKELKKLKKE